MYRVLFIIIAVLAIALGLLPRMAIRQTSETQIGQIYMPSINWLLLAIHLPRSIMTSPSRCTWMIPTGITLNCMWTSLRRGRPTLNASRKLHRLPYSVSCMSVRCMAPHVMACVNQPGVGGIVRD